MLNSIDPGETGKNKTPQLKLGLVTAVHTEDVVEQDKMYQECKGQTCGMLKCMYPPESDM